MNPKLTIRAKPFKLKSPFWANLKEKMRIKSIDEPSENVSLFNKTVDVLFWIVETVTITGMYNLVLLPIPMFFGFQPPIPYWLVFIITAICAVPMSLRPTESELKYRIPNKKVEVQVKEVPVRVYPEVLVRVYPRVREIGLWEYFVPRSPNKKYLSAIKDPSVIKDARKRLEIDQKYGQAYDYMSWCEVTFEGFLAHWNAYFKNAKLEVKEGYLEGYLDEWFINQYMHHYDHQLFVDGKWISGNTNKEKE